MTVCREAGKGMSVPLVTSRRLFLKRAVATLAMPAVVRVATLMPIPRQRIYQASLKMTLAEWVRLQSAFDMEKIISLLTAADEIVDDMHHSLPSRVASSVPAAALIPPQSWRSMVGSATHSNYQAMLYEGFVTEGYGHSNNLSNATKVRM